MQNFYGKKRVGMFLVILCLLGIQACGASSGGSTPTTTPTTTTTTTTTDFEAVFTDTLGTESGAIDTTVQALAKSSPFSIIRSAFAASSTATGTLTLVDGGTVDLTGTFEDPTLRLSGGGYTFTGTVSGDNIEGTYTGTDVTGGFAGLNSTTNTVTVYCGTWDRPADQAHDCSHHRSGVWNIAASNGVLTGVENRDDGTHVNTLSGTVSGNDITITNDGEGGTGTGTISGDTVSGRFTNRKGCPGTWEGTAGCE